MLTLLVDGDIFIYKACFDAEINVEWSPGQYSNTANLPQAVDYFRRRIDGLAEKYSGRPIICLSDFEKNFRKGIYPEYKRPRNKIRRPTLLKVMRDWVRKEYPDFFQRPFLEADDVMGILATAPVIKGQKRIVTIDKDLLQIPGYHINPDKPELGVRKIQLPEADMNFYTQVLTGDSVDNFPGCPGIGDKRAAKILAETPEEDDKYFPWEAIVRAYEKAGKDEEFALVQARMARILRAEDWNQKKKEAIPWEPKLSS